MNDTRLDEFPALYFEELVLHEELPPCEGEQHSIGAVGHEPGSPAEFLVTFPPCHCGIDRVRFCAGRAAYWQKVKAEGGMRRCLACAGVYDSQLIEFYPL